MLQWVLGVECGFVEFEAEFVVVWWSRAMVCDTQLYVGVAPIVAVVDDGLVVDGWVVAEVPHFVVTSGIGAANVVAAAVGSQPESVV